MLLRFMKGLELFIPFFRSGDPPLPMFEARARDDSASRSARLRMPAASPSHRLRPE